MDYALVYGSFAAVQPASSALQRLPPGTPCTDGVRKQTKPLALLTARAVPLQSIIPLSPQLGIVSA